MRTDPTTWGRLQAALGYLHHAAFAVRGGDREAALIFIEDVRVVLGELALEMSETHELERHAWEQLMRTLVTPLGLPRMSVQSRKLAVLSPDVLDPAGALGVSGVLTALALWLWRPRRAPYTSLDCLDGVHAACEDCDGCACHGDWAREA